MITKQFLNFTDINQAWILHREEIETVTDGVCNIYVLLDAYSMHCFAQELSVDLPTPSKIINALESAILKSKARPQQILISKSDPFIEAFKAICKELEIPMAEHTNKDLLPFVKPFKDSFQQFQKISTQSALQSAKTEIRSEVEQEELKAFVPDSYSLCPCASGKKFKFCCQKLFKDITFAMCAAEEGQLEEALKFMNAAEEKVGRTAEVVCRTAICWSYYDMDKFRLLLKEAIEINPKHPRLNYILGIEAVTAEYYKAIANTQPIGFNQIPQTTKYYPRSCY